MGATIHTRGDRRRSLGGTFSASVLFCGVVFGVVLPGKSPAAVGAVSDQETYGVDSIAALRSRPVRNWDSIEASGRFYVPEKEENATPRIQTEVELPEATSTRRGDKEFRSYWKQVEKGGGLDELRGRQRSWDIDKTWVPHLYFFDSNLVVFPGFFVLRKKK
jgi:hypothetical protein